LKWLRTIGKACLEEAHPKITKINQKKLSKLKRIKKRK
jgi:hypothetical protein